MRDQGWEFSQGPAALGTPWVQHQKVHFTPALAANPHQTPVGTGSTFQYTTHTRFGANSSRFYWPDGKCAFRSEHKPAPELPGQPPGTSTSPALPAWRESSASSQLEGADLCSRGWNQQSATWFPQYRVKYSMNMKSNSTKCLRTFCFQGAKHGGFLSPQKWVEYL